MLADINRANDGIAGVAVPSIDIRPAQDVDLPDLERLVAAAWAELDGRKGAWLWARFNAPPGNISEVSRLAISDISTTLIGSIDQTPVGFGCFHIERLHHPAAAITGESCEANPSQTLLGVVDGLYVEEEGRCVGVGDALILAMMDICREAHCVGIDAWALPGERQTKNFYEAHEFSARSITVHHSFIGPTHRSRTEGLRSTLE